MEKTKSDKMENRANKVLFAIVIAIVYFLPGLITAMFLPNNFFDDITSYIMLCLIMSAFILSFCVWIIILIILSLPCYVLIGMNAFSLLGEILRKVYEYIEKN